MAGSNTSDAYSLVNKAMDNIMGFLYLKESNKNPQQAAPIIENQGTDFKKYIPIIIVGIVLIFVFKKLKG